MSGCSYWKGNENHVRLAIAGSTGSLQYLPHLLASQLGFYRQNGVELSVEYLLGSNALRALLGGSADVVAGYFEHPVRIAARGRKVRSFAVLNTCPGDVVLVSHLAAGRIREMEDLRNGAIGVPDLGGHAQWFINYLASMRGIRPDALKITAVGMPASAVAALERGTIDVWTAFEPGLTRFLSRHPQASILADARSPDALNRLIGAPAYPGGVLYSTAGWLERFPDRARRLAASLRASLRWIQAHTPEEIMDKVPQSYTGEERTLYLQALRNLYALYSPDGSMPPSGPETVFKVLATSLPELREGGFDLKDTWTNEFIQS
jgi:NitT/TauT family transport system substrate-binding protein